MSFRIPYFNNKIIQARPNIILSFGKAIPPPYFWLRADSVEYDTNNRVHLMRDVSGNGLNAIQNTQTAKPLLMPGYIFGNPALSFNGVSQFMTVALPESIVMPATYFVVYETKSNSTNPAFGGSFGHIASTINHTGPGMYAGAWLATASIPLTFPMRQFTLCFGGANSELRSNGIAYNYGNSGGLVQTSPFYIGRYAGLSPQWGDVNICEIIAYKRQLFTEEITTVETYLMNKYAL